MNPDLHMIPARHLRALRRVTEAAYAVEADAERQSSPYGGSDVYLVSFAPMHALCEALRDLLVTEHAQVNRSNEP